MKKAIAMKWVKALESGKYEQTDGELRGASGYCCLGVLCDIVGKDVGLTPSEEGTGFQEDDAYHNELLPQSVIDYVGFQSDDGAIKQYGRNKKPTSLACLNDKGMSFKRIAKIIRRRYNEL